jgi:hypothetical protein
VIPKNIANKIRPVFFISKKKLKFDSGYCTVHPHLLYCQPIYRCTSGKNLGKLEELHKKLIRIISAMRNSTLIQESFFEKTEGHHARRFYKRRADVVFAIYIAVVHTWSFFSDQWRL